MNKKAKLMTEVEKAVHKYIESIKEMSVDSTVLYIQRNNIPVDRDSMNKTIEVFKMSLDSQQMQLLDRLVRDLDKSIGEALKDD
jgi:hypothetical protein